MWKRICAMLLALCMVVSMILTVAIPAQAVSNMYYDEFGITYQQLFSLYPMYLQSEEEEQVTDILIDQYTQAVDRHKGEHPAAQLIIELLSEGNWTELSAELVMRRMLNPYGFPLDYAKDKAEELQRETILMLLENIYCDESALSSTYTLLDDMLDLSKTALDLDEI